MAGADTITELDRTAFAAIKERAQNGKARMLIHQDALKDSHVIAERQKDRGSFLRNSKSLAGDSFDLMEDSYSTSKGTHNINEEVGQAGVKYDKMLEDRMAKLNQSVNNQQTSSDLGLISKNKIAYGETPRASQFLPKEILEAFQKTQTTNNDIDVSNKFTNHEVQEVKQIMNVGKNKSESKMIVEQTKNVIDYELIKSIIESTVKKYASALNKKIINESKTLSGGKLNELKAMKIGDKFSFISENGDIYEAKLTYKGNIKEKS